MKERQRTDKLVTRLRYDEMLTMKDGESLYDALNKLFPEFYHIDIIDEKYHHYLIKVAKGNKDYDIYLSYKQPDRDERHQFTYSLGTDENSMGYYLEVSYNDVNKIMTSWFRNNKLDQLGIN